MTDKHTPGPWRYAPATALALPSIDSPGANRMVAKLTMGPDTDANGAIIAAAPDLLAALRVMVNDASIRGDYAKPYVTAARLAIAKAEGRS